MNYEEIIDIWQCQDDPVLVIDEERFVGALRNAHRREERKILWLNFQEVVPAVFLFVFFGGCGLLMESGAWAFFTGAFLCLGVGLFLLGSTIQQRVSESVFGDEIKDQLHRALSQVTHREWLYRNILWWYLLPGVFGWGAIVYEFGLKKGPSTFLIVYILIAFVFFAWVYWANRRIARNHYRPRRERLEAMLRRIESNDDKSA